MRGDDNGNRTAHSALLESSSDIVHSGTDCGIHLRDCRYTPSEACRCLFIFVRGLRCHRTIRSQSWCLSQRSSRDRHFATRQQSRNLGRFPFIHSCERRCYCILRYQWQFCLLLHSSRSMTRTTSLLQNQCSSNSSTLFVSRGKAGPHNPQSFAFVDAEGNRGAPVRVERSGLVAVSAPHMEFHLLLQHHADDHSPAIPAPLRPHGRKWEAARTT